MGLCALPPSFHPAYSRPWGPLFSPGDNAVVFEFPRQCSGGGDRNYRDWGTLLGVREHLLGEECQGSERVQPGQFASSDGECPTTEPLHLHGVRV